MERICEIRVGHAQAEKASSFHPMIIRVHPWSPFTARSFRRERVISGRYASASPLSYQ